MSDLSSKMTDSLPEQMQADTVTWKAGMTYVLSASQIHADTVTWKAGMIYVLPASQAWTNQLLGTTSHGMNTEVRHLQDPRLHLRREQWHGPSCPLRS